MDSLELVMSFLLNSPDIGISKKNIFTDKNQHNENTKRYSHWAAHCSFLEKRSEWTAKTLYHHRLTFSLHRLASVFLWTNFPRHVTSYELHTHAIIENFLNSIYCSVDAVTFLLARYFYSSHLLRSVVTLEEKEDLKFAKEILSAGGSL